ncbi:alpha/beta hydrolase [Pseudobacter ginsenosidimutans]|uniref:Pimeloyl-ACP methyl ester carboxylesterase n=1 Tax=Pseudobacter ginsenosidimutans TaxID=661488 RepID=A0A4Q7N5C7_9BACT|nr:alpha/beta hydrolase [Pseudobacter ginsenosidimutans]QEC44745.1 alpha/beta hydrolase [Pseudobacter ginsenosidimutans]RZS76229.1 pimeloyl-ACP methyl ester carboxylesterase [Pseudobacter ginsenosidimutans]
MEKKTLTNTLKSGLIAAAMTFTATTAINTDAEAQQVKNVVLVHGAFADGSGYKNLYTELTKKGYNVTVVQNPLSSLEADVEATKRALDKQDGPAILAGHSWGGVVITEAGNHPKVAGLVYIAAFQPDKGESGLQWVQSAPPAPENGITAPDENGIVYFEKSKYHAGFCADIPKEQADFMYASQGTFYAKAFATSITNAAWRSKPAFGIVATEDKAIVPEIQRNMYKRSNTKITEIKGSHVVFMSQPAKVAAVIIDAAKSVSK